MNILISYYSRTKTTEKVAIKLKEKLNCDLEEIIDKKDNSGPISYLISLLKALRSSPSDIKEIKKILKTMI
ncbi:MAG: hypothetical protein KO202_06020 [Methanobacteriaceae archaeon]|jgi:flavodoxin|nr:hypothetical protein [Methanobacteriaceae archaeon]